MWPSSVNPPYGLVVNHSLVDITNDNNLQLAVVFSLDSGFPATF